jgi:hypothetical protein
VALKLSYRGRTLSAHLVALVPGAITLLAVIFYVVQYW